MNLVVQLFEPIMKYKVEDFEDPCALFPDYCQKTAEQIGRKTYKYHDRWGCYIRSKFISFKVGPSDCRMARPQVADGGEGL
jgi:hypothetical protein